MKHQSTIYERIRTDRRIWAALWLCLSLLLACSILFVLYKKLPRKTVVSNIRSYNHMTLLTGWTTVTQRFTAEHNGFDGVTLVYAWSKSVDSHGETVQTSFTPTGTMDYRLTDAGGRTLASGRMNRAQAIADNCYCLLTFAPIAHSKGQVFTLTLLMAKDAQILGPYTTRNDARVTLKVDGKANNSALVAEYTYAESQLMTDIQSFLKGESIFWALILSIIAICLLSLLACYYLIRRA